MNDARVSRKYKPDTENLDNTCGPSLISIIIPNYNHAGYVGDAIQSALNQTFKNYEIIVVDDGSNDNSQEVVARFGKKVQYIWQKNQGLSAARNTGLKVAQGIFIGLLDADDMYEPNFLETLVSILINHPELDGIYCGYQFVDHLNHSLPQVEARITAEGQLFNSLINGNFLVPESILVRRSCYEAVGLFDETLRACEDWDMWLRIARQFNIAGINQVLTRHRVLPNSMSSDPMRMFNNRLAVLRKQFGSEPSTGQEWEHIQKRAYGQAYLTSAVEQLQSENSDLAYRFVVEMAVTCPELLTELSTFYELGCGNQPKGYRGDYISLHIHQNAGVLLQMLDKLFKEEQLKDKLKNSKIDTYANAYMVLGYLSYGAKRFREARGFLVRSIITNPRLIGKKQVILTIIKSFLETILLNGLRKKQLSLAKYP